MNFIPDYISLLETRYIVEVMKTKNSLLWIVSLILIDIVLTISIFVFIGASSVVLFYQLGYILSEHTIPSQVSIIDAIDGATVVFTEILTRGLKLEITAGFPVSLGIFLYTTFFTSVWIWLFVSGWLVIRNGARFQGILAGLQFALPIKTKPMRAIGEVAAILTVLVFVVAGTL